MLSALDDQSSYGKSDPVSLHLYAVQMLAELFQIFLMCLFRCESVKNATFQAEFRWNPV